MMINLGRLAVFLVVLTGISGFNIAFMAGGIHAVFDLVLNDADTNIGIRADIGGSFISMTIFMIWALYKTDSRWLLPPIISLACIMFVRLFNTTQFGFTEVQVAIIGIEIVMIGLLSFGAFTCGRAPQSH